MKPINFVKLPPEELENLRLALVEVADVQGPALLTVALGPCGGICYLSVEIKLNFNMGKGLCLLKPIQH